VVLWIALSVNSKQLRNIGRAKRIVCPTNPTVGRATALPAHYVPAPLIFAADSIGLSSLKFSWWAPKTHVFWNRVGNIRSRSFMVIDFRNNRKRVCNFVLVINSNLVRILSLFRDIAGFLFRTANQRLFYQNLGCSPWASLPMLWLRGAKTLSYSLSRAITFELVQPKWPRCINVTDGQTDRRTT